MGKVAWVGGAIVLKFFVIVDIMTNLVGKINVQPGPLLSKYMDGIEQALLPSISFMDSFPVGDGGGDFHDQYLDLQESDSLYLHEQIEKKIGKKSTTPSRNL